VPRLRAPVWEREEVGEALKEALENGTVKREDVFVASKLWCTTSAKHRVAQVRKPSLFIPGAPSPAFLRMHLNAVTCAFQPQWQRQRHGFVVPLPPALPPASWAAAVACVLRPISTNRTLYLFLPSSVALPLVAFRPWTGL